MERVRPVTDDDPIAADAGQHKCNKLVVHAKVNKISQKQFCPHHGGQLLELKKLPPAGALLNHPNNHVTRFEFYDYRFAFRCWFNYRVPE